jgi:hypothetical protein
MPPAGDGRGGRGREASDPELLCEVLELLATAVRPRDLHAAADVLSRALAEAERAKLVLWRLRALNEHVG